MGIRSRPSSIEAKGYWMIQDCGFVWNVNHIVFGLGCDWTKSESRSSPSSPSTDAEVAPPLFEALSTLPLLTQVSYISSDDLFFSYYKDGTHTFTIYSNTTFA
ncbi:hypothetical protein Drorol1_Dr00020886 [Drosera rotundifolia]